MKRLTLTRFIGQVLGSVFLLAMAACHGNTPVLDREAPQVDILQPLDGQSQAAGTPLAIEVRIIENDALHGWEIIAINQATGRQVDYHHGHEHSTDLLLVDTLFLTGAMDCRLLIRADDHSGNRGETEIMVHLTE